MLLDGFERGLIELPVGSFPYAKAGSGDPVLLLHGHPQTHLMWHRVAPILARRFTVVLTDLRGYGDAPKPPTDPQHAPYSKRAMAADQVAIMERLGFSRFAVVGHDRGGRVGHRLAIDHADRVTRFAALDIAPTLGMYEGTDMAFATSYFHWFFLIQPKGLPERMIGADPNFYGHWMFGRGRDDFFDPAAMDEYLRCLRDPRTIHAMCEDYRAAAGIDLEHDRADLDRRLACPVLVLWAEKGVVGTQFDPMAEWRKRAETVEGKPMPGGHYLAEEIPEEVAGELTRFLAA